MRWTGRGAAVALACFMEVVCAGSDSLAQVDVSVEVAENGLADHCPELGLGDEDGRLDPGEWFDLFVSLKNDSNSLDLSSVLGLLSAVSTGVLVLHGNEWQDFGSVDAGQSAQNSAPYTVATERESHACGDGIVFEILVDSMQGQGVAGFVIAIPPDCHPCPGDPCARGVPGRVSGLAVARMGDDLALYWSLDARAEGGYNLYEGARKIDVPSLRIDKLASPFGHAAPSGPLPFVYTGSTWDGLRFYQVLGVCADGQTEGPN